MFGTIKTIDKVGRTFGFIESPRADYFFHKTDFDGHWVDLLEDYDNDVEIQVEFEPKRTDKGLRAESVRRIS